MSINVKKYTKDQMEKMVEEAQEKNAALEAEIVELKTTLISRRNSSPRVWTLEQEYTERTIT